MSILRLAVATCLTGVAVLAAPDPSKVTFNKDVLPILQKNCQNCHRPGEVAPMSLADIQRRPAMGQSDQGRGGFPEDAAMARRAQASAISRTIVR